MSEGFTPLAGGIRLHLVPWQVDLLVEVVTLVEGASEDPALPVAAYKDDAAEDAQFQRLIAPERTHARDADQSAVLLTLEQAVGGVLISRPEGEAWLRVLGESRLILAARLGVEDGTWEDDDGQEDGGLAILHYLTWLQGALTEVLSDELP